MEHMIDVPEIDGDIKWKKNMNCDSKMVKAFKEFLSEHNISKSDKKWYIYFPCNYNNIKKEMTEIHLESSDSDKRIFVIDQADQLSSKNYLWENIYNAYGIDEAKKIMPNTYILFKKEDIKRLRSDYVKGGIYIAKKNIQRQKGLKITKDLEFLCDGFKDGYVIAQEMLQDPYLVNKRKINLRMYIAVFCKGGKVSCHVHKDGFMYYTRDEFFPGSLQDGPNITTGYIDRKVYEVNPLTHDDFRKFLDGDNRVLLKEEEKLKSNNIKISEHVFENIYTLIEKVMRSVEKKICLDPKLYNQISFQMFGADVAINDKLEAQMIEINKGPDLGYKDKNDGALKKKVVYDMFSMLKIVPEKKNGFIELF